MRRWNDDPYTKKARREDYAARSVYKLEEIQRRERILQNAKLILDLGASPGSWTQYCLKAAPQAAVVAVDLAPLSVKDARITFFQEDIESVRLDKAIAGRPVDVVLSDMAPKTSGIPDRDVALSFELAAMAVRACDRFLRRGGHFVAKLFMGESLGEFEALLKARFEQVRLLRPESTRKHSREIFFIGKRFRGAPPDAESVS
jgi:23S rRNA (uridine2552-2'-O)-methyltransferase